MKYIYNKGEGIKSLENFTDNPLKIKSIRLGSMSSLSTEELRPFLNIEQLFIGKVEDLSMLNLGSFTQLKEVAIQTVQKISVSKLNLPKSIDRLIITNCPLEPKLDLSNLDSLEELEIQNTGIKELLLTPKNPFIKSILLSKNQLTQIPLYINTYSSLKILSLMNNKIKSLPIFNAGLSLTTIYLGSNDISQITEELQTLTNLEALHLSINSITNIEQLPPQIKKLNLNHNRLRSLPKSIHNLKKLKELSINSNPIKTIDFASLTELEVLNCTTCQISYLPQNFKPAPELKKINFSDNPNNTPTLKIDGNQLEEIQLFSCNIKEIDLNTDLTKVQIINLNYNELTNIPNWVFEATNLKVLHLIGNKLTNIDPRLSQLLHLTDLNLSDNQIKSIPEDLIELPTLEKLDLSENELTSFNLKKDQVSPHLQHIDLSYNTVQIEDIAFDINTLPFKMMF